MIHGGPGLSLDSLVNLEALARADRRIVSFDQRGAGESDKPGDGDFSLDAQLRDIEAVRVWTGAQRIDLLGQSWGGLLAAAYTARNPDTVRSLVLLDAAPLDWSAFLAGQQSFTDRENRLRAQGLVPAVLPPDVGDSCLPSLLARVPVYLASPTDRAPEFHTMCTASTARATYAAMQTPAAQAELTLLADALGQYHGHALVIMGSEDPFGNGWLSSAVQLLHGAQVDRLVVAGAGHLSSLERPAVVLAAIDRELAAA
jgi:pimeloyl-ACP methyl ester carboxylesterase